MACRFCQLPIPGGVCQVCQFLIAGPPALCQHCGACVAKPTLTGQLCQLCNVLLETVRSRRWFLFAQAEWDQENFELAKRKRELLGHSGGEQDRFAV